MDNRLHLCFFLNRRKNDKHYNSAIYLRVTIGGIRQSIHTGVFTNSEKWDAPKRRIKADNDTDLLKNQLLLALETRVNEIYVDLIKQKQPITSLAIKQRLRTESHKSCTLMQLMTNHNHYVKKRVGIDVTLSTQYKYSCLTVKVGKYLHKEYGCDDIPLNTLNRAFLIGFELYLKADEKIGHNTAIKYIQFLKRVINYGIGMEWLLYDPFKAFKCTVKPVNREFLSQDEINRLQAKQFTQQSLSNVRNLFVFSCYTGLAYADIFKLRWSEIGKGIDGNLWIQTYRAKTTTRVPVPLLPQALEILLHSAVGMNESELVFKVPTNQKVNEFLKEIGRKCNIRKRLTFHIARHTFATTVTLTNGVPIETVSKMLGHTNIKTTQIYSKVVDTKISEDMIMLARRLNKTNIIPVIITKLDETGL